MISSTFTLIIGIVFTLASIASLCISIVFNPKIFRGWCGMAYIASFTVCMACSVGLTLISLGI